MFCDIPVLNFARHLKRQHFEEIEVQAYLNLNKNDPKRKHLVNKMRKEGDFCTGDIIPVQSEKVTSSGAGCNLLPCTSCKGLLVNNKRFVLNNFGFL